MNARNWSIRSKIISLVAAPLTALLALWIFATVLTAGPAMHLLQVQTLLDTIGKPGEVLVAELQQERRATAVYLAGDGDGAQLSAQRVRTDRVVADFRRAAGGDDAREAAGDELEPKIDAVFAALDGLSAARGYVDRREVDPARGAAFYTAVIEASFRMFYATSTLNEPGIDRGIRALTTVGRGREWLSQTDAQLGAAFAAGRITDADHARLVGTIATQRFLYAEGTADLPPSDRLAYQAVAVRREVVELARLQDALISADRRTGALPFDAATWRATYDPAVQQLRGFEQAATETLADRAAPVAGAVLLRLALAGLLGLAAVVVSVLVSVRLGRSLIGRLTGLRAAALDLAGRRLPTVVTRLRRGETVDVDAEAPPLEYGSDEIGQLGHAFTEVQRTAVRSAVDEAALRSGLNEVFLNIARRSQALLHRQLALLDRMERRTADPRELEDLYRVDHLATRMRRHAEDLVILAGASPGRGWRNPVPVVDVVRGAISEVEDYQRIDVTGVEDAAVVGRAVGDIIHLLAELLENAASFSPPNTRVHVSGQCLPNGYAVEIEDRGLGMTPEALDAANRDLLEPPAFDPGDSARLGLYVVARLGTRHGVRVQLRRSPFGGVTAVALIPAALITTAGGPAALPPGPAADGPHRPAPGSPAIPAADRTGVPNALPGGDLSGGGPSGAGEPVGGAGDGSDGAGLPSRRGRHAATPPEPAATPPGFAATPPGLAATPPGFAATPPGLAATPREPAAAPPGVVPHPRTSEESLLVGPDGLAQRRRARRSPVASPAGAGPTADPGGASPAADPGGAGRAADPGGAGPAADPAGAGAAADAGGAPHGLDDGGPVADPEAAGADGLPRRVRQAHIAPQLRTGPATTPDPVSRSPEQVRALMSALQSGTAEGRRSAAGAADPAAAGPPAAHAAGDTVGDALGDTVGDTAGLTVGDAAGDAAGDAGAAGTPVDLPTAGGMAVASPAAADDVPVAGNGDGRGTDGGLTVAWSNAVTAAYPTAGAPAAVPVAGTPPAPVVVHHGEVLPARARSAARPASSTIGHPEENGVPAPADEDG